jgi:hypothetical protein
VEGGIRRGPKKWLKQVREGERERRERGGGREGGRGRENDGERARERESERETRHVQDVYIPFAEST